MVTWSGRMWVTTVTSEMYPLEGQACFPNLQNVGFKNATSLAVLDCRLPCADGTVDTLRIYFNPESHVPGAPHCDSHTMFFVTRVVKGYTVDYSTVHNEYVSIIISR